MKKDMHVVCSLDCACSVSADKLVSFLALIRVRMTGELSHEFAACGDV